MLKINILKTFLKVRESLKALGAEMKELRPAVIGILEKEPDKQIVVGDKTICLAMKQRKRFDMKAAKEKLGKLLAPFFKTKEYPEISVLGEIEDDEDGE